MNFCYEQRTVPNLCAFHDPLRKQFESGLKIDKLSDIVPAELKAIGAPAQTLSPTDS